MAGIPELSPEAKVGKILTLIGFILDVVGVVAGILFFIFFFVFGTFFVLPTSPTYPSSFPFAFLSAPKRIGDNTDKISAKNHIKRGESNNSKQHIK